MSSPSPELPHIATFHTHYGALCFQRRLAGLGERAVLAPVPRKLSVSCGTCVRYEAADPCRALLDADLEAVYEEQDGSYGLLFSSDSH